MISVMDAHINKQLLNRQPTQHRETVFQENVPSQEFVTNVILQNNDEFKKFCILSHFDKICINLLAKTLDGFARL